MDILRFITAGSIDDGKSTLIGRLLMDTSNIKDDILDSIAGAATGAGNFNLAFITDGLRAERQAGITIDVAYKYFTTPHRKYIITDAPGHFQYTKNLVTGASGVDAIIILIDAVNGISAQTRRHTEVAAFLNIAHIVVAVNKMDLVGYNPAVFQAIHDEFLLLAASLSLQHSTFIPMCALGGDNVIHPSAHMPWYSGPTLLSFLQGCQPSVPAQSAPVRLPVQYAHNGHYYGTLAAGTLHIGDEVQVLPSGTRTTVQSIIHNYQSLPAAVAGQDICITLAGGTALRGDLIAASAMPPQVGSSLEAHICWLDDTAPLLIGKDYLLRINASETPCRIVAIHPKSQGAQAVQQSGIETVTVNDFAAIKIATSAPVAYDPFTVIHDTGRGILIDPVTNNTSGALIMR